MTLTASDALGEISAHAHAQKAAEMAAYHKVERPYLGVANPVLDDLTKGWRKACTIEERAALAAGLWDTNIFEARVAAAKLFTQARIRPDDAIWTEICRWVPEFDSWAIADHACSAGGRRLMADPSRLDVVESWTTHENKWARRAALIMTLPWTKQNHPSEAELIARDRILGWAAGYVADPDWFIQKAIGWWLRSLSKHDPARVNTFIDLYGDQMKPFARREATRNMKPD